MDSGQRAYLPRVADGEVDAHLRRSGAVLIEGPKGCGKTETGRRFAASEVKVDVDPSVATSMAIDPNLVINGAVPRLLDEWQAQPGLWNVVRHAIDARQEKGQFILTGSAHPVEDAQMHSGAGRISRLRMRPMSLRESGASSGEVRLGSLLDGEDPATVMKEPALETVIDLVVRGGWPGNYDADLEDARSQMQDYVDLLVDVDVSRVSERRRDPIRVRQLLRAIARSVGTEANVATLTHDVAGQADPLAWETVNDYLDVLARLMILDNVPAWSSHLRSSATLRKSPKRHFVDPALAVAALGASPDQLLRDLEFTGQLFESLVMRDLRVYSQPHGAQVFHARDSYGNEVDAIVQRRDGSWLAVEVKLGPGAVDDAATSLHRFVQAIDTVRTGACLGKVVITGWGVAHRRPDGVAVVPLTALRD